MKTDLIMAKVSFLRGMLNPDTVDGGPGQPGPIFQPAIANYAIAELLQQVGNNLNDKQHSERLHEIGKDLVVESSGQMTADWEDGEICPPWRFPFPVGGSGRREPNPNPWLGPLFEPDPSPWLQHSTPALRDILLATALRQLASLTTSEKASAAMKQIGESIVKGASNKLFDEYCGTPVKPRAPVRKKAATAA
jgi:hypothetical protein